MRRAELQTLRRWRRRPCGRRGSPPARARWRLAPPSSAASSCARLYSQCTSASHVKPMPPCAWIALAVTSRPASDAAALAIAAASASRSGSASARPRGERRRRARLLGFQQHLRAAMRDRLVGADRHAELLALLDVGHRHLERALAHADELRADRDERAVDAAGAVARRAARRRRRRRSRAPPSASGRSTATGLTSASCARQQARRCRRLRRARSRPPRRRRSRAPRCRRPRTPSAPIVSPEASPGSQRSRCSGEPACSISVRRHRARQERHRRERASELLAQDRQLDRAEALAAVLLGDRDPRPAQLAQLAPQRRRRCVPASACSRTRSGVARSASSSRAVRWISRWSSVRPKSMRPTPRPSAAAGRARARRRCS